MASKKKLLQAAAGAAGGAGLDIDEVFSTYLYEGTGSAQTITNGIDLSGEGGLVWQKSRENGDNHRLSDTERGVNKTLSSDLQVAEYSTSGVNSVSQFNSNGFVSGLSDTFFNGEDIVSWTFRKAPKWFDVKTVTHTNGSDTVVSFSDLGTIGMVIAKKTTATEDWFVSHRYNNSKYLVLNSTAAEANVTGNYGISGTNFTLQQGLSSGTYVLYAFAHNDGDGEFGPDADQDIIKCGSWTGSGSSGTQVDLGFEPQWVMIKQTSGSSGSGWMLFDAMRGMGVDQNQRLLPNSSDAEDDYQAGTVPVSTNATGFKVNSSFFYDSSRTFIYMAIRRGPLAAPESATDVFAIDTRSAFSGNVGSWSSGFVTDFALKKRSGVSGDWQAAPRLVSEKYLIPNSTAAESTDGNNEWDFMDGYGDATSALSDQYSWMWKRAPGYFDVVAWTGTGSNMNISHNLGVVPEMIWARPRSYADNWSVFHKDLTYNVRLNDNSAMGTGQVFGTLTSSVMPTASGSIHASGQTYIAYLFATVAGISKVGSYTGNGTSQTIDCGFTNGAKFIIIKRASAAEDWLVHDSVRGIISGSGDPYLTLNSTDSQFTSQNYVDPHSSGFTVPTGDPQNNNNGDTYIFYAIAA